MRPRRFFYRRYYRFHQLSDEEMLMEILMPVIAVIVMILVLFFIEYGKVLLIFFIAISIGFIAYLITNLCIKRIRYNKNKSDYLTTYYYKETQRPFTKDILSRELNFEISVYNSIRETIGKRYYLLHQHQVQKSKDSLSTISIDLLLFHTSGIYVIETMNLTMNSITKLKAKELDDLKFEKVKDYNLFNMHKLERVRQYEKWIKSNTTHNPLSLNQRKIDILKSKYGVEFENALVFSPEMLMGEENFPKTISSIYSEPEFMEHLRTTKTVYNDFQLYRIYQAFRDESLMKGINL